MQYTIHFQNKTHYNRPNHTHNYIIKNFLTNYAVYLEMDKTTLN